MGVYIFYTAVISLIAAIGQAVFFPKGTDETGLGKNVLVLSVVFNIVGAVLNAVFAFFLLFRAEWLADKVKLTENPYPAERHVGRPELRFGVILIGVYVFLTRIGGLVFTFLKTQTAHNLNRYDNPFTGTEPSGLFFSTNIIKPLVPVVLSLLLLFASGPIARFLIKEDTTENQPMGNPDYKENLNLCVYYFNIYT